MKYITLIFILLLSACSDTSPLLDTSENKTVEYYMQNQDVMNETVEHCKYLESPRKFPNCIKAIEANDKIELKELIGSSDELNFIKQ
ncbi:EexN family lipoprotein [uncultured Shewanella sp.]|uniref:EexN family lipoprotein n=1 Tax=uncultured Shewanella sp. TaxID=173975 RepID=UPI00261A39A1|nr:EexN family lipoprotein [uncultured Shewanella sp.]